VLCHRFWEKHGLEFYRKLFKEEVAALKVGKGVNERDLSPLVEC
jgi:hypothetical protein